MRLDQHAAVRDRAIERRHLDRRRCEALADRVAHQARAIPLGFGQSPALALGGQVDAGVLAESKPPDRRGEPLLSELLRDQDRADVGGDGEDLRRRPMLVGATHVTVQVADREGLAGVLVADRDARRYAEHPLRSDHARVERRREHDRLEGRAGLVDVDLPAHAAALVGARREAAVGQRGSRREGERLSRARIEHHRGAAACVPGRDRLLQHTADQLVEPLVDREAHVVPGHRRRRLDGARHLSRALERERGLDAVLRAQVAIEARLGTVLRALAVDEADELADRRAMRVDTLQRLGDEADQTSLDERSEQGVRRDPVTRAGVESAGDDRPLVRGAVDRLAHRSNGRLGHDPRDRPRDRIDAVDVPAIERQLVGLDRERERHTVAIGDRAARSPQRALLALLHERLLRVGRVVEHLQLQRARGQQAEQQGDACEEQPDAPVRVACRRLGAPPTGHARDTSSPSRAAEPCRTRRPAS